MIAFRAVPGERVVIKGSELVTNWVRCADEPGRPLWEADWKWDHLFPSMICPDDVEDPLIPLNVHPQTEALKPPKEYCQYFVGLGRGRGQMFPGTFFYDEARKKLLVWLKDGGDPNGHPMEAAVRHAMEIRGCYILVEGLHFQYAPQGVPVGGYVVGVSGVGGGGSSADGVIIRNCEVSHGAFGGLYVRGGAKADTLVENCWVHHNGNGYGGFEGFGAATDSSWTIVRRCRFTDNNLYRWNHFWDAGGKHFGRRVLFDECEIARQHWSTGIWFDCHQRDVIVNRCYTHDTDDMGLYYEIGETGAFINNVVEGATNCCGVSFGGTSRSLIAHNLILARERGAIVGWEGNLEGQASRVTCHNSVYNNIFMGQNYPLLTITQEKDIACGNRSDNNLFWRLSGAEQPGPLAGWKCVEDGFWTPVDLAWWRTNRKLDLNSRVVDPRVTWVGQRVVRRFGSPARTGGQRLTKEMLRAIFAVQPMPAVHDVGSPSIKDHEPPSEAFLDKVAELLYVPAGRAVPVGPLPKR